MDPKESAEMILSKSRKEIVLPVLGATVMIGKVYPGDFLRAGLDIPVRLDEEEIPEGSTDEEQEALLKTKQARSLEANPTKMIEHQRTILEAGFLSPDLVISDDNHVEPGQVHIRDLADDYYWIIKQIMEFSNLGKAGRAVSSFRKEESAGGSGSS